MGGLKNIFLRIIPIIMLICFVCFGISYTFKIQNLTYLSSKTENGMTTYYFDLVSYVRNLNINILKQATNETIDIQTFKNVVASIRNTWKDGYQIMDATKTISNVLILIIDGILQVINFSLIPIRLCAGILLTGLSAMGININADGVIIKVLKTILTEAKIPLINTWGVGGDNGSSIKLIGKVVSNN